MSFNADYVERVYAGVLGKIIGVYLGRPFEGWHYDRIINELGVIEYYVHKKLGHPLVVSDDDLSGTFTFIRALEDYGYDPGLTSAQIGHTWLNYLIEKRTIIWWGGLGNTAEHTAYCRLKKGYDAPYSGSISLNGKTIAELIGGQIFIDGWALVCPADPDLAVELAGKAAQVSHDGEAVCAAQMLAAMEAMAFIEQDINRLIDIGLSYIPASSIVYRLVNDIRNWHAIEPDWRQTRLRIVEKYGYNKFPGDCPIIPNHALIHLAMLYGEDNFQKTLSIVNTSGWDTDCNSGNVGCLMGIKNGLAGIECGPDWRSPIADRLYLPSADGGRCITDAVKETQSLVKTAHRLKGINYSPPKCGALYHFELPGSVQGFQTEDGPETEDVLSLKNTKGHSRIGSRSLELAYRKLAPGRSARALTATFIPPEAIQMPHYPLFACPRLYPSQEVKAELESDLRNDADVLCCLYIRYYGNDDQYLFLPGPDETFSPGERKVVSWVIPELDGAPIAGMGVEIRCDRATSGSVYLDTLTWQGIPTVNLNRPKDPGLMWKRAWVDGVDYWDPKGPEAYRLIQNEGTGLLIQGNREWANYQVSANVTYHLIKRGGIAINVQGMRRYYALLLCRDQKVRMVKEFEGTTVLAQQDLAWEEEQSFDLCLRYNDGVLQAFIDSKLVFDIADHDPLLNHGAIAFVCEEGCLSSEEVHISPI